ncbi:MAG: HAD-IA family hydrolase [Alphaproteobacteria bacterium]|nr:HAD-IA family hydrolase [Alphaproteobacteria bacterium]MBU1526600.1 HAD-IA family hydrolase [Alphaproteobacteria bacterium]MBU2116910.1 HAD-IA family hydrolase [Alphaproteobacteria bacterium]MBU2351569.1 HAD-IA family hydrolase [Alphaproteobacteria bacterium]MBU2383152.1 HAD-IA family hydrolase [Alphaproteobacteria bacterium]
MKDLTGWTIAFDLDGTLMETAPDLIGTLNRLLALRGLPPRPISAARHLVGHGAVALLKDGFREAGADWDEAAQPALLAAFLEDYLAHICDHSHVYPGVEDALERLAARGAVLCVATNKPTHLSLALFGKLGLTDRFAAICGADAVSARKPDAAHIRETVLKAGGDPARAIMVGDSITDVSAARATGVPVIMTSFGYTEIPARDLGGDALIDGYGELEAAVDGIVAARLASPISPGYVPAS